MREADLQGEICHVFPGGMQRRGLAPANWSSLCNLLIASCPGTGPKRSQGVGWDDNIMSITKAMMGAGSSDPL